MKNRLTKIQWTGYRCELIFKEAGWFSKELHRVEGFIFDKKYVIHLESGELSKQADWMLQENPEGIPLRQVDWESQICRYPR